MDELVRVSRAPIPVVELHRPERRHAMNTPLLEQLIAALSQCAGDPAVTALVITGSGGCFSAGADVTEGLDHAGAVTRMELFARLYDLLTLYPRPTVAAIDGWCIGGGAEVACACDLRVATPGASIRFPGASFGIPAGAGRLPVLVGVSHAKDLLMTARAVSGEEAYRMGLVNRLAAPADLRERALALAAQMAANPGARAQKEAVHRGAGLAERVATENRALVAWQDGAAGLMG